LRVRSGGLSGVITATIVSVENELERAVGSASRRRIAAGAGYSATRAENLQRQVLFGGAKRCLQSIRSATFGIKEIERLIAKLQLDKEILVEPETKTKREEE
jgi:hypothetical protein